MMNTMETMVVPTAQSSKRSSPCGDPKRGLRLYRPRAERLGSLRVGRSRYRPRAQRQATARLQPSKKELALTALKPKRPPTPPSAPLRSLPPTQPVRREQGTCNVHRCTCHQAYDDAGRYHPHPGMLYCIPTTGRGRHLGSFTYLDAENEWQYVRYPLTASQIRRRNASTNRPFSRRPELKLAREVVIDTSSVPTYSPPRTAPIPRRRLKLPPRPRLPRVPTIQRFSFGCGWTTPGEYGRMHQMHLDHIAFVEEEIRRRRIMLPVEIARWERLRDQLRTEHLAATKLQAVWRGWYVSSRIFPSSVQMIWRGSNVPSLLPPDIVRHVRLFKHNRRCAHFYVNGYFLRRAALQIQKSFRAFRMRAAVRRRFQYRHLCATINSASRRRNSAAATIQANYRRWLVQRRWRVSYARNLATKRLCLATTAHTRMLQGRPFDISAILQISKPWPNLPARPPTPPLHRIPPTTLRKQLSALADTFVPSTYYPAVGGSCLYNIRRRKELLAIASKNIVTKQVQRGLRLPYGDIRPEQVYAFAYHDKSLC